DRRCRSDLLDQGFEGVRTPVDRHHAGGPAGVFGAEGHTRHHPGESVFGGLALLLEAGDEGNPLPRLLRAVRDGDQRPAILVPQTARGHEAALRPSARKRRKDPDPVEPLRGNPLTEGPERRRQGPRNADVSLRHRCTPLLPYGSEGSGMDAGPAASLTTATTRATAASSGPSTTAPEARTCPPP